MRLTRCLSFARTLAQRVMSTSMQEQEIFIKAPWGRIALLTWGDPKKEPILMCHGKQDVGIGYKPLVEKLPSNYFYVSVDLPGNGKSDHMPKGVALSVMDLVPTIKLINEHFKWKNFVFIGHSLGVLIGKYYMIAYPSIITKLVELDPMPAYITYSSDKLQSWYDYFFATYYDKYDKNNASAETAPKHTYEKILQTVMGARILSKEAAKPITDRVIEPAGDGLYRFTFDQRMKTVSWPPMSSESLKELYTSFQIPILCILASKTVEQGLYDDVPFIQREEDYKGGNYRVLTVPGYHDVHISDPALISEAIAKFLAEGVKAKL